MASYKITPRRHQQSVAWQRHGIIAIKKKGERHRQQVLDLLMSGYKPFEIAKVMRLSFRAVRKILSTFYRSREIDVSRTVFIPSIRLFYIEAIKRGLISENLFKGSQ